MTAFIPTSPCFNQFGNKRRSSATSYSDDVANPSLSSNPFKRQRNYDVSTVEGEETLYQGGGQCQEQYQQGKRSRLSMNEDQTNCHSNGLPNQFPTFHASQNFDSSSHTMNNYNANLRAEFEASINQKDLAILSLHSSAQQMERALSETQRERSVVDGENKILKRAVAIQDSRQKELAGQNQQLQHVLAQAAEHISNLERSNRELRLSMENKGQYQTNSNYNYRPPDVY
jgi:hypothetical protein